VVISVRVSDDPGEAGVNVFILKATGYPDVRVLVMQAADLSPISRLENLSAAHVTSSRRGRHAL
jgi:hypothetical protein